MKLFGLIGYPLTHSFSKKFFSEKFDKEGIIDCHYELFELESIDQFPNLIKAHPNLLGLNVTIPYKETIMPYLADLDPSAQKVGAVNVIKNLDGKLIGFNSDYHGFKYSLDGLRQGKVIRQAVVLGTGGASKAVVAVLKDMGTDIMLVSRSAKGGAITYPELTNSDFFSKADLIVNTTPLGMYPEIAAAPAIPYEQIHEKTLAFDLIYNPATTEFLKLARLKGAKTQNGLEMLEQQALKSWEIWQA